MALLHLFGCSSMCLGDERSAGFGDKEKPFPWEVRQIRARLELFVNTVLGQEQRFSKPRYLEAVNRFSGLAIPSIPEPEYQVVLLQGPSPSAAAPVLKSSAELLKAALDQICLQDYEIGRLIQDLLACAVFNPASAKGAFLGSSMSAVGVVWLDDSLTPRQLAREVAHEAIHTAINIHDALYPLFKPAARSVLALSCVKHRDRPYDMSLHAAFVHAGLVPLGLAQYEKGITTSEGVTVAQPECTVEGLRVYVSELVVKSDSCLTDEGRRLLGKLAIELDLNGAVRAPPSNKSSSEAGWIREFDDPLGELRADTRMAACNSAESNELAVSLEAFSKQHTQLASRHLQWVWSDEYDSPDPIESNDTFILAPTNLLDEAKVSFQLKSPSQEATQGVSIHETFTWDNGDDYRRQLDHYQKEIISKHLPKSESSDVTWLKQSRIPGKPEYDHTYEMLISRRVRLLHHNVLTAIVIATHATVNLPFVVLQLLVEQLCSNIEPVSNWGSGQRIHQAAQKAFVDKLTLSCAGGTDDLLQRFYQLRLSNGKPVPPVCPPCVLTCCVGGDLSDQRRMGAGGDGQREWQTHFWSDAVSHGDLLLVGTPSLDAPHTEYGLEMPNRLAVMLQHLTNVGLTNRWAILNMLQNISTGSTNWDQQMERWSALLAKEVGSEDVIRAQREETDRKKREQEAKENAWKASFPPREPADAEAAEHRRLRFAQQRSEGDAASLGLGHEEALAIGMQNNYDAKPAVMLEVLVTDSD